MDKLMTLDIREIVGSVSLIVSFILVVIFLWQKSKEESLKLIGVMTVIGISLFAHDEWSYFLTILVLATFVTNLDFLQNIAAIIRNSDAYFSHLESQSQKEIEETVKAEIDEIDNAIDDGENNDVSVTLDKTNLNPMQFALLTEDYTFKFLENKYGVHIKRYVKVNTDDYRRMEFDGIINMKEKDVILEIKSSRRGSIPTGYIKKNMERSYNKIKEFKSKSIFRSNIELRYILIGNFSNNLKERFLALKDELNKNYSIDIQFEFYSFEEIGLKEVLNID